MQQWTDSWLALVIVVALAWQVVGPELVELLTFDRSTDVEKYIKLRGEQLCQYSPPEREHIQQHFTPQESKFVLSSARIIDGNGTYCGLWDIHVENGKIEALKRRRMGSEVAIGQDGLWGRYVTPGLIDPWGGPIEQEGVTTRIVYDEETGYGSAVKGSTNVLLMSNGWVRLASSEHDSFQQKSSRARKLWVDQQLWCEKMEKDGKMYTPVPEDDELQPLVNTFRGARLIDSSVSPLIGSTASHDLLFQAQMGYHRGDKSGIARVTGDMADLLGIPEVGYIRPGYDADLVIWDRHPMELGAAPEEIYINGEPQLGLPLRMAHIEEYEPYSRYNGTLWSMGLSNFVVTGIKESHVSHPTAQVLRPQDRFQLVVEKGHVICFAIDCRRHFGTSFQLDLDTAYILPGATSIMLLNGTDLAQPSVQPRAKDAVIFDDDDANSFLHLGVEYIIAVPPETQDFFRGYSACFRGGELIHDEVALHVSIAEPSAIKMAWLRQFNERVVVHTDNHRVMLRLIDLKRELGIDIIIFGGGEAHLIAQELAISQVPVILTSVTSQMGHPSNLNLLYSAGVKLGFTTDADVLHFKAGAAAELSGIPRNEVLDMISWNIFEILGMAKPADLSFVVTEQFGLQTGSHIAAVVENGVLRLVSRA